MEATNEQLKIALKKILNAYDALQASDGANIYFSPDSTAGDWVGRRMETPMIEAGELLLLTGKSVTISEKKYRDLLDIASYVRGLPGMTSARTAIVDKAVCVFKD